MKFQPASSRPTTFVFAALLLSAAFVRGADAPVATSPTNQLGLGAGPIPAQPLEAGPLVQWSASAGGNNRYFQAVCAPKGINWADAEALAVAHGGHLAAITSAAENNFVFHLIDEPKFWQNTSYASRPSSMGPWLGGVKKPNSTKEGGSWQWLEGNGSFNYTAWVPGQPDNGRGSGGEDRVHFMGSGANHRQPTWNVLDHGQTTLGFVVEFPADASTGTGDQPYLAGQTVYPVPTPATTRLVAVQTALLAVDVALQNAVEAGPGGYLEKSRASMNDALVAIARCLAIARAETDPGPMPSSPSARLIALQNQIGDRLGKDHSYLRTAPKISRALHELQTAVAQLELLPAGDEGGARNRLVGQLELVLANLGAGIDVAKVQSAPAVPIVVRGPDGLPTDLALLSAAYGVDTRRKDLTLLVTEMVGPQSIAMVVGNGPLKGDPAPNVVKDIVIKYLYRGEMNAVNVREGDLLSYQLLVMYATHPSG